MENPRYRNYYNVCRYHLHHIRCQSVETQNHSNRYRNFAKSLGKKKQVGTFYITKLKKSSWLMELILINGHVHTRNVILIINGSFVGFQSYLSQSILCLKMWYLVTTSMLEKVFIFKEDLCKITYVKKN